MLEEKMYKPSLASMAVIFLGFLLTSTGWIAWNYHVQEYMAPDKANFVTMVAGYAMQALGIGLFALILRYKSSASGIALPVLVLLHMAAMIPALLWEGAAGVAAGLLMEIFCGLIAGYYLFYFTCSTPVTHRGRVFGTGYGLSVPMSWLLSLIGGSSFYYSRKVLAVSAVFSAIMIYIVAKYPAQEERVPVAGRYPAEGGGNTGGASRSGRGPENVKYSGTPEKSAPLDLWLQGILVLLLGVVIGCGFSFIPSSIGETVNVEMSRLVYVFSLVSAGFVADRSREKGAICALTVLVFPLVMLSLREATIPAVMFWLLSYFAFGFYSVYRVLLFSDLNILYLSGFGLMIGRIGDAVGEAISLALYERPIIHVVLTAALSVTAIFVFFRVYHDLYIKESGAAGTEEERVGNAETLLHTRAAESGPGAPVAEQSLRPESLKTKDMRTGGFRSGEYGTVASESVASGTVASGTVASGLVVSGPVNSGHGTGSENGRSETEADRAGERRYGSEADRAVDRPSGPEAEVKQLPGSEDCFFRFSARYELSPREREIFRMILSEKTNGEIADALYISENTVKFHVRNILKKTGCKNRNGLVMAYASEL